MDTYDNVSMLKNAYLCGVISMSELRDRIRFEMEARSAERRIAYDCDGYTLCIVPWDVA